MAKVAEVSSRRRGKGGPAKRRAPFECVALLLQGGGSLGAYQGGVYQALAEADLHPNWVAGISVGAINAAILAGSPPEKRVEQLHAFWDRVTANPFGRWAEPWFVNDAALAGIGDTAHGFLDQFRAFQALVAGAPDFFKPRFPPPWMSAPGSLKATSFYDTAALKTTLESLVDFDRINSKAMRFSVGAVNVRTGNFVYFDSTTHRLRAEHVMASGALPPGFPAVEIDGEHYWDGGLISNTPLRWLVENERHRDTLAFQVDLWPSRGELPRNIAQVSTRQKEIQYSSRTRADSDRFRELQVLRNALSRLIEKLPADLAESPEVAILRPASEVKVWNLIQLIYRSKEYEGDFKDYEFSRRSMEDHWRAGYHDTIRTLRHPEVLERPRSLDGVFMFDFAEHGRE